MRRGRPNVVKDPYTIQDSYKDYVEQYPEGSINYLTYSEYKTITTEFFKYMADKMVNKSLTVTLPFRLGEISVEKHKPAYKSLRNMAIDWGLSKEHSKQIRQFNAHSNGYIYRFYWDRRKCLTPHHSSYTFKPSRANKREVARLIKNKENDYFLA